MRVLLHLVLLFTATAGFGEVPALDLGRPLPNGCVIHALLYATALDPAVGTAEVVKVTGGGGVPHAIAVVTTPAGARFGRDEFLGVFALGTRTPQEAYDRARREAMARRRIGSGRDIVGASEERRSLSEAYARLEAAGFGPRQVKDTIVWHAGVITYVYSPKRGCAEIRTCSRDSVRIAAVAADYWEGRL